MLPHPPRDSRTFETRSGKAEFTVSPMNVLDVPAGRLLLQSIRSHDQFNTTIYGHDDRYRGIKGGRDVVLLHPDDIADLGLAEGQLVDLVGAPDDDGTTRVASGFRLVAYETPRGCAAAYYPEMNVLVALDATARGSNQPVSKSVLVRVVPSDGPAQSRQPSAGRHGAPVGADDEHKSDVQPYHLS